MTLWKKAASPNTTRSSVVLQIAAGLVAADDQPNRLAKVLLRESGGREWPICLVSSSASDSIAAVVGGEAALATINPAAALAVAYRGAAPYDGPQPVRTIGVIPSHDQILFAVKSETGLQYLEDIGTRRFPLKVSIRGNPDHGIHLIFRHVLEAAGFSFDDVSSWGGMVHQEGGLPRPGDEKFALVQSGTLNALFDEGAAGWIDAALDAGMTVLSLKPETVTRLEAKGYRRGVIRQALHPRLAADVLSVDFSGWTIFVHADLDDALVEQMCLALNERRHLIPWQEESPLPLERMCRDGEDTPMDVPLHPAAERYWRSCGYLPGE